MRASLYFVAALLATVPAGAQERGLGTKRNANEVTAISSRGASNGFGVMMLVTADYEGFWRAWEGPTPPQVSTTERVERGKPVHAMLLFHGCRPGSSGNCDVSAKLKVTGPDGRPYGKVLQGAAWKGPPAPGHNLQLSQASLGFILEPGDRLGRHRLEAAVTDEIAGTTVTVHQVVTAINGLGARRKAKGR